jgi:protein TonB
VTLTEPQPQNTRWTIAATLAVGLHGAAIGALLFHLVFESRPAPMGAIAVDLAAEAVAPPAPKHEVAPGPQQVEAPKAQPKPTPNVKKLPFDPPPETQATDAKPDVAFEKTSKPDSKPIDQPKPPAPQTTREASLNLKEDKAVAAPQIGGLINGSNKPQDLWEARVGAKLQRLKRYPAASMSLHEEDSVMVHFVIDRTGKVLSAEVVRSRGFARLDAEAIDLLRRASPLPKPPPEVEGQTIERTVPIEFFVDKNQGR